MTQAIITNFFQSVWGADPVIGKEKRSTVYSFNQTKITTDSYGGCHLEMQPVHPEIDAKAKAAIEQLANAFRELKAFDSIWINFNLPCNPAHFGRIVPDSFTIGVEGKGDLIQDVQQKKIRIWQWLNPEKECTIPPGATHNMGATALIIDMEASKVLLVVNVRRNRSWNLPGGSFEPWKDINLADTALREAQEEGGFELSSPLTRKPKLVGELQFPDNPFAPAINQIWAFFMSGLSQQQLKPPPQEIQRAEWIDFDEIAKCKDTLRGYKLSDEIKLPLKAALHRYGFEEVSNKGWMIVHTQNVPNVDRMYAVLTAGIVRRKIRKAIDSAKSAFDQPLTQLEYRFIGKHSFGMRYSSNSAFEFLEGCQGEALSLSGRPGFWSHGKGTIFSETRKEFQLRSDPLEEIKAYEQNVRQFIINSIQNTFSHRLDRTSTVKDGLASIQDSLDSVGFLLGHFYDARYPIHISKNYELGTIDIKNRFLTPDQKQKAIRLFMMDPELITQFEDILHKPITKHLDRICNQIADNLWKQVRFEIRKLYHLQDL